MFSDSAICWDQEPTVYARSEGLSFQEPESLQDIKYIIFRDVQDTGKLGSFKSINDT